MAFDLDGAHRWLGEHHPMTMHPDDVKKLGNLLIDALDEIKQMRAVFGILREDLVALNLPWSLEDGDDGRFKLLDSEGSEIAYLGMDPHGDQDTMLDRETTAFIAKLLNTMKSNL